MAETVTPSLVQQFASMKPNEYDDEFILREVSPETLLATAPVRR